MLKNKEKNLGGQAISDPEVVLLARGAHPAEGAEAEGEYVTTCIKNIPLNSLSQAKFKISQKN